MAYYNWRVTGSALTLPYTVLFRTYLYRRMFVWQKNRPEPAYGHPMLKQAYESLERRDLPRLEFARAKFQYPLTTYFGGVLVFLVPLMFGPWGWGRRIRPVAVISAVTFLAIAAEYWAHAHYSAPAAALYGVMVQTLRRVNTREGRPGLSGGPWPRKL